MPLPMPINLPLRTVIVTGDELLEFLAGSFSIRPSPEADVPLEREIIRQEILEAQDDTAMSSARIQIKFGREIRWDALCSG